MKTRFPKMFPGTSARFAGRGMRAFTLIELLVVITIIGLMARVALPALKGMNKSNSMITAQRQLLDDMAFARHSAIANRTDVYVVFIPPWIATDAIFNKPVSIDGRINSLYTNLYQGQNNTYAILTLRSVGDQPGQPTPRYLTDWRTLPKGVFIDTNKFIQNPSFGTNPGSEYTNAFASTNNLFFPFPAISSNHYYTVTQLPYVCFDYLGRLKSPSANLKSPLNEAIPLVRGSMLYHPAPDGSYPRQVGDFIKQPVVPSAGDETNVIHIDWLTGRARIDKTEIQ